MRARVRGLITMEVDLEAEYIISEREYVQASKLYARLTKKHVMVSLVIITILIAVAYFAGNSVFRGAAIGGLAGGVGGYLICRFLFAPWKTKRLYRSYAAIKEPCTVKNHDEGVKFLSKSGEALIEWKHIMKWRQDDEFLLIYQAPHLYHLIPKRLGTIVNHIVERLIENVGKES